MSYNLFTVVGFQYLTDVEEHLGVSIPETDCSMKVEANEFDGKVVYGEKRSDKGKFKSFKLYILFVDPASCMRQWC